MRLLTLLLLPLALSACSAAATTPQTHASGTADVQRVDAFEHGGYVVTVYFTDPLLQVLRGDPGFTDRPPREQAQALSDYLHHNAVYRFVVETHGGERVGELALEGDPDITDSAAFYRVRTFRPAGSGLEAAGTERIGVRGMLFEHMAPFQTPEGRRAVGSGIAFFEGIFMRVTPYSEIKEAMLPHIDRITG